MIECTSFSEWSETNALLSLLSPLVYNMPVSIRYDWNCMGHISFWSVLMIFILFGKNKIPWWKAGDPLVGIPSVSVFQGQSWFYWLQRALSHSTAMSWAIQVKNFWQWLWIFWLPKWERTYVGVGHPSTSHNRKEQRRKRKMCSILIIHPRLRPHSMRLGYVKKNQ